jgi:hypothetical protein
MKLYGDLMRLLPLTDKSRMNLIKSNKLIRLCSRFNSLIKIFNHFVSYYELEINDKYHKFIFKIIIHKAHKLMIPDHITHILCCDDSFNADKLNKLPKSLKYLYLNCSSTINFKASHSNIKYLKIGGYTCNCPINDLSKNLKYLKYLILDCEIESLDFLSNLDSLIYLKIGHYIKCDVNNLPSSLKYLVIGSSIEGPINSLPDNLIYLEFAYMHVWNIGLWNNGDMYLETYDGLITKLPSSLKYLKISSNYEEQLSMLPNMDKVKIIYF